MRRLLLGLVVCSVVVAGFLSACGEAGAPAEESAGAQGEVLLEQRCTECHGLDRVTSAEKTEAEWEETVTRMIDRGAELNDDEAAVVVDYLAATYGP